ncbi:hypothetical protein [Orlajensenia flava]|uniref:hypothetical protein n=1 Tax=Orlajensenia flava TaxID=2565934 RepID=UPI001F424198|nr:hypothetical protein [Glaciibacter flavus]
MGGASDSPAASPAGRSPRRAPAPLSGIVVIGASAALWWPAFTLGAWGTLFFDQLLTVWVIATAALVIVLVQPRGFRHRIRTALALAVPSIWLVLGFALNEATDDVLVILVDAVGIASAIIGIPFTIWVLVRILWPDFGAGVTRSRRAILLIAVAVITIGCYLLGVYQASFLTCEDFEISGNSDPPGCVHAPAN